MRENGTFLAILALASLALFGKVPESGGEAATRAPGEVRVVRDPPAAGGETCDSAAVLRQIDRLYPGFQREVIIATVPDPIDSQAGWLFDAQLEAIVGAIERKVTQSNYSRDRYALPWNCAAAECGGWGDLSTLEGTIEDAAHCAPWRSDRRWTRIVFFVVLGSAIVGLSRVIPVIDSKGWHCGLVLAQSAVLLGVLLAYVRFAVLWRELQKLLQHFSMHPMAGAFERLPRRLIGQLRLRWHPLPAMPRTGPLLGQCLQLLAHHIDVVGAVGGSAHEVAEAGLEATRQIAALVRTERWLRPPVTSAPEAANLATLAAPTQDPRQVWFDRAEELIAIHVAQYINYVFLHLWNLLTCAMLALLLLLFASGAYPWQPQQLLNAFLFAIAVTVVGWTLRVLVQINRNDLPSRIQKTEPNKTTFDRPLVAQFLLYGVVPVLTLLATLFPGMAGVFSWVAELLRLVK